jgi:hypothetical protein
VCAIHLAHAACAEGGEDLIGAEARAGRQGHAGRILSRIDARVEIGRELSRSICR